MADALLTHIAPLAHPARVTALWKFGREHIVAPIIAELESRGGYYEQRVAATLAAAAGDTSWAAVNLASPNPSVRRKAFQLAPQLPDSAIKDALRDAPASVRFPLYRQLKGRSKLADELVKTVRTEWGEEEATRILPWCSETVARREAPSLLLALARTQLWRHVAISHPGALHQSLVADLHQSVKQGITVSAWWNLYDTAVGMLVKHAGMAKEALELIEAYEYAGPALSFDNYSAKYVRLEPERTLSYLAKPRLDPYFSGIDVVSARSYRRLVRSGLTQVNQLTKAIGARDDVVLLARYLMSFPPSDRAKHYEIVKGHNPEMLFRYHSSKLLSILPKMYLGGLARDIVGPFRAKGSWVRFVPLAYLPQDEVQDEFLEGTRKPDAADRGLAWKWYIINAKVSGPHALAKAAGEAARRLRNEQQPVRYDAIRALADVPARLWNEASLEHLTTIMKDAAQARDGDGEWMFFNDIAAAVLGTHADSARHVEWVQETFDILAKLDIQTSVPNLNGLRKGQEATLWNVYRPFMAAEAADHNYNILFHFARNLGKRAANLPELQDALWSAIEDKETDHYSLQTAIDLWLRPKLHRSNRVVQLIDRDESIVSLEVPAQMIATHRTDLLDRALGSAPNGVFKPTTAWVFPAPKMSAQIWTPAQTAAYLSQLQRCASDSETPTRQKMDGLKRLKGVPGGLALARSLASDPSNEVAIVEAGLAALYTSPADLDLLYSFAGSEFARVAIYSAAGAANRECPSLLEPRLVGVLGRDKVKVTSKKEVIRQATSLLPLRASLPLLRAFAAKDDLHRDVRIACVLAGTRMLSADAAWDVIRGALVANEPYVKQAVCNVSTLGLTQEQRARYAPIIVKLAQDEDINVKSAAVDALATWAPFSPDAGSRLVATVTDMSAPTRVWQAAVRSLDAWGDMESLLLAASTLIRHGDEPDAGEEEDMPAVRRIEAMTEALQSRRHTRHYHSVIRAAADLFAQHNDYVPAAARLRMALLDRSLPLVPALTSRTEQLREELLAIARLCANRPMLASGLCTVITGRNSWWSGGMEPVARALVDDGGTASGLFALALITHNGKQGKQAWTDEWRKMLRELRRHPNPDVRDRARSTRVKGSGSGWDEVW